MSARTAAGRSGGHDDYYMHGSKMPSTSEHGGDGLDRNGGGRGRGQGRKAGSRDDNIPHLPKERLAILEKLRKELPTEDETEDDRHARDARSSGTSGKPDESDDYRRMHQRTERTDQRESKQQHSKSHRSTYKLCSVDDWPRDDDSEIGSDDDDADELNNMIKRLILAREQKMRAENRRRRGEDIVRRLEEAMQKKSDPQQHASIHLLGGSLRLRQRGLLSRFSGSPCALLPPFS